MTAPPPPSTGGAAPLTLGIETSCDETAVAVLKPDGAVALNLVSSQVAAHAPYLGVVPEVASRRHLEALPRLLAEADRSVGLGGVELVAVTCGPGLIGALLVGTSFASAYAWARGLPLVGVDHLEGHLVSPFISLDGKPAVPLPDRGLTLVVSGGHSSCFLMDGGETRPLNRTRDDAAGEVFDKVAAALGLAYPGGPIIDRLAEGGDPHAFSFSAPRIKDPHGVLDYSFSGLKTATIRTAAELGCVPLVDAAQPPQIALDLLASFRHTVVTWLLAPVPELLQRYRPQALAVSGGVAANAELRRRIHALGETSGVPVILPPVALTTDNAAMIARAGQLRALAGRLDDPFTLRAYPRALFKGGSDSRGRPTFPAL